MADENKKLFTNSQNNGNGATNPQSDNQANLSEIKKDSPAASEDFNFSFQDLEADKAAKKETNIPVASENKAIPIPKAPEESKKEVGISTTDSTTINKPKPVVSPKISIPTPKPVQKSIPETSKPSPTPAPTSEQKIETATPEIKTEKAISPQATPIKENIVKPEIDTTVGVSIPAAMNKEISTPKPTPVKESQTQTISSAEQEKVNTQTDSLLEGNLDLDSMIDMFDKKETVNPPDKGGKGGYSEKNQAPSQVLLSKGSAEGQEQPPQPPLSGGSEKTPAVTANLGAGTKATPTQTVESKEPMPEIKLDAFGPTVKASAEDQVNVSNQLKGEEKVNKKPAKKKGLSTIILIVLILLSLSVAYFMYPEGIATIIGLNGPEDIIPSQVATGDETTTDFVDTEAIETGEVTILDEEDIDSIFATGEDSMTGEDTIIENSALTGEDNIFNNTGVEESQQETGDSQFDPFQDLETLIDSEDQAQKDMIAKLNFYISKGEYYEEVGTESDNQEMIKYATYIQNRAADFVQEIKDTNEVNKEKIDKYTSQFDRYLGKLDELEATLTGQDIIITAEDLNSTGAIPAGETETGDITHGITDNTGADSLFQVVEVIEENIFTGS